MYRVFNTRTDDFLDGHPHRGPIPHKTRPKRDGLSGVKGTRTLYLLIANQSLYQMSYDPWIS